MKETRILMGMPITIEIIDSKANQKMIDEVFLYFYYVDQKFSVYKKDSETTKINRQEIKSDKYSLDMKIVLFLSDVTKNETDGYFDVYHQGSLDPSGLVKGWAIFNASKILKNFGLKNYYIEAGGDIQAFGRNSFGQKWRVGIRNPFDIHQIVKVVEISDMGIATSGTYFRGQHIYNHKSLISASDLLSLTVIGPDIYQADRFATAAFAMGKKGINFINRLAGFEGYSIDDQGTALYTSGFDQYITHD
jgi:thiamine biosynthesis lipoprotein